MLSQNRNSSSLETTEGMISEASSLTETDGALRSSHVGTATNFYGRYHDCMDLYANPQVVAEYLSSHREWFTRCADPMKVQPLGENGYDLAIGQFGAFGYDVEPKIGLELLPPEEGNWNIRTIPIPDYQAYGYDVDFRASLSLQEKSDSLTTVEWELDLTVYIHFPKFIQRLPKSLIQSTGDRILNQIVRQVSRRLTRKVQEDFHQSQGIPFSAKEQKRK